MDLKLFNFAGHRIGDKICAAYQLDYYRTKNKCNLIMIDTTYNNPKNFPAKLFFPQLGEFFIECSDREGKALQEELGKHYECLGFGNLWISGPSLLQDTGFLPHMYIHPVLKLKQRNINYIDKDNKTNNIMESKKQGKKFILMHCLTDAPYNTGRNHNQEQWNELINKLQNKYPNDIIMTVPIGVNNLIVLDIFLMIDLCDLFIGGDTGFSHAAAALNKPILAIYGNDSHDVAAFEEECKRMNASHCWCSDPLTHNMVKIVMKDHIFDMNNAIGQIDFLLQSQNREK